MTTPPKYSAFEKEFLTNVYLSVNAIGKNSFIVEANQQSPNATRVEEISNAPSWIPDFAKSPFGTSKSAVAGIGLIPDYDKNSFLNTLQKPENKGALENAFKKFGGIEFREPLNTSSTFIIEMTKGQPDEVAKGTQKIYQAAVNYVNSELSTQEKNILASVIKNYRSTDGKDSFEAVTSVESASLAKLTKAFLNNDVKGGQTLTEKQLGQLAKETHIDLKILQQAANTPVK